jgi:lipoprotein-anchoring transpeptidase ErfK/SrfK
MTTITQRSSKAGAWRRRAMLAGLLALCCAWSGLTAVSAAAARTSRRVGDTQLLAVLLDPHHAHQSPRTSAPLVASLPTRTPITGEQTTLPVVGQATSRRGVRWLKVMLPGRPNGSTGWIARNGTRELSTGWRIVVNTSARRLWIYFNGRLQRTFQAVVGKPSTPTPSGKFFVEETMIMPASEAGGPFALALSARSDVLQQFDGGPGQIAIHGRDSLGGTLGTAASHGCVRLASGAISWLAARIVPGVPVRIAG